jgi:ABC-type multidrug transport system fused ATPase/permease subunit
MQDLRKLFSLVRSFWGPLFFVLVLMSIAGLMELVAPWILREVIDFLTEPSKHFILHYDLVQSLIILLVLWLATLIVTDALDAWGWYLYSFVWTKVNIALKSDANQQVLTLSLEDI